MLINLRSINNKVYHLTELLIEKSIDICCMTETWLRSANEPSVALLRQEGYDVISIPRTTKRGGGVAFLYRSKAYDVRKLKTLNFEFFELLEVALVGKLDILRFSIIYRTS